MIRLTPIYTLTSTHFPYTTLLRSIRAGRECSVSLTRARVCDAVRSQWRSPCPANAHASLQAPARRFADVDPDTDAAHVACEPDAASAPERVVAHTCSPAVRRRRHEAGDDRHVEPADHLAVGRRRDHAATVSLAYERQINMHWRTVLARWLHVDAARTLAHCVTRDRVRCWRCVFGRRPPENEAPVVLPLRWPGRSEEPRAGKEGAVTCKSRWS